MRLTELGVGLCDLPAPLNYLFLVATVTISFTQTLCYPISEITYAVFIYLGIAEDLLDFGHHENLPRPFFT